MSPLFDLTLSALLFLAPSEASRDFPRAERLAGAIVEAVEEREALASWLPGAADPLPWREKEGPAATALALAAIAVHESGLRAEVADCRRTGDQGRSLTAFQLMRGWAWGGHGRAELCGSERLAAKRALAVLAMQGVRGRSPRSWFDGYSSGDAGRRTAAGARQCALWERAAWSAGFLASCQDRIIRRVEGATHDLNRKSTPLLGRAWACQSRDRLCCHIARSGGTTSRPRSEPGAPRD